MGFLKNLYNMLRFELPSDYDDFYDELDWRSFRTDQTVYNRFYHIETDYIRALTYCFDSMVEDLQLNTVLDSKRLIEKYNDMIEDTTNMKLELAEAKAEIAVLTKQLADARSYQTQAGRKIELGIEPQVDTVPERTKDGKFISSDGVSTKIKQMVLFAAKNEGMDIESVADELGVKPGSIPPYVSNGKKSCTGITTDENGNILYFWGNNASYQDDEAFKNLLKGFKKALKPASKAV